MKHNRKMVLVPEEVMGLIREKMELQTSPLMKSMSSLSQHMTDTLNNGKLPDDLKLKNHDQHFQRFLNLQQQQESFVPTVRVLPTVQPQSLELQEAQQPQPATPQVAQSQAISEAEILGTVPKKFQTQARGLLQWMRRSPGSIRWDDRGVVSLDGNTIDGSSITDLVNDALRSRKGFSPIGRFDFAKVLAKMNTPEEFIGNSQRRELMSAYKTGQERRLLPLTPDLEEAPLFPTPPTKPRKRQISPALQRRRLRVQSPAGRKELTWISYD